MAAPTVISVIVRRPADFECSSRSKPITPPISSATRILTRSSGVKTGISGSFSKTNWAAIRLPLKLYYRLFFIIIYNAERLSPRTLPPKAGLSRAARRRLRLEVTTAM